MGTNGPRLALALGALAGATAWLVARLVCDWAHRRQILDIPNARSSHQRPTPRLGGVGIVAGVSVSLLVGSRWLEAAAAGRLRAVLAVGLVVAAASLLDDIRGLPARVRLALHLLAAVAVVYLTGVLGRVPFAASPAQAGLLAAVAVFWVVAFVNAFNFMDGIDGIAGGQAVVAGAAWTAIGASTGDAAALSIGAIIAGAAGGFLILNWSPARIFMGDVGSAFLGFLIAACPLLAADPRRAALPAVLVVWPFLFDTGFTLVRRARRGENLFEAHRGHLYQRLTATGRTHARVAALYAALAAAGGLVAWGLAVRGLGWALPAIVALGGLAVALWAQVASRERALSRGHHAR